MPMLAMTTAILATLSATAQPGGYRPSTTDPAPRLREAPAGPRGEASRTDADDGNGAWYRRALLCDARTDKRRAARACRRNAPD